MKFEASHMDLADALAKCVLAADEKSPHTPFRNCLLSTDGKDQVRLYSQTEAIAVDTVLPATVKEQGKFIASPKRLAEIVAAIKGRVAFDLSNKTKKLTVKSVEQKRSYVVNGTTCEMKSLEKSPPSCVSVSAADLLRCLDTIRFAVPSDNTEKWAVAAAQMRFTDSQFRVAASNGRAMARATGALPSPAPIDITTITLPQRSFGVLKLMGKDDDKLTISSSSHRVFIENRTTLVAVTLPSGEFPPIDQVVDGYVDRNKSEPHATAATGLLLDAVRSMLAVRADASIGVRLELHSDGIGVSIEDAEGNVGSEDVAVEGAGGKFKCKVDTQKTIQALSGLASHSTVDCAFMDDSILLFSVPGIEIVLSTILLQGNEK